MGRARPQWGRGGTTCKHSTAVNTNTFCPKDIVNYISIYHILDIQKVKYPAKPTTRSPRTIPSYPNKPNRHHKSSKHGMGTLHQVSLTP